MAAQDAHPFPWHYPDDGPDVDDKNFRLRGHGLFLLSVVLSSLFLLLTLFCLYLKWARRNRNIESADPHSTSSPNGNCFPSGLDVEAIKSLPVVLHRRQSLDSNEEEEEGAQCSICLGVLAEGVDKVKVLPVCGHVFHPECIDRWLRTQSSCPLCRASLIVVDCKVTKILDAC